MFRNSFYDALSKGLTSVGYNLPKTGSALVTIGGVENREKLLQTSALLKSLGFKIFATETTAEFFEKKNKIAGILISEILTINGVRFILENGSWGLIRASSNKPSLVVVTESTQSIDEMKAIFSFIDNLLKATGKIGKYDQKI